MSAHASAEEPPDEQQRSRKHRLDWDSDKNADLGMDGTGGVDEGAAANGDGRDALGAQPHASTIGTGSERDGGLRRVRAKTDDASASDHSCSSSPPSPLSAQAPAPLPPAPGATTVPLLSAAYERSQGAQGVQAPFPLAQTGWSYAAAAHPTPAAPAAAAAASPALHTPSVWISDASPSFLTASPSTDAHPVLARFPSWQAHLQLDPSSSSSSSSPSSLSRIATPAVAPAAVSGLGDFDKQILQIFMAQENQGQQQTVEAATSSAGTSSAASLSTASSLLPGHFHRPYLEASDPSSDSDLDAHDPHQQEALLSSTLHTPAQDEHSRHSEETEHYEEHPFSDDGQGEQNYFHPDQEHDAHDDADVYNDDESRLLGFPASTDDYQLLSALDAHQLMEYFGINQSAAADGGDNSSSSNNNNNNNNNNDDTELSEFSWMHRDDDEADLALFQPSAAFAMADADNDAEENPPWTEAHESQAPANTESPLHLSSAAALNVPGAASASSSSSAAAKQKRAPKSSTKQGKAPAGPGDAPSSAAAQGTALAGDKPVKRRHSHKKRVGKPKMPVPAFLFFARDVRPTLRSSFPDAKITEIAIRIGKLWAALPLEERARYEKMAAEEKLRYREQVSNIDYATASSTSAASSSSSAPSTSSFSAAAVVSGANGSSSKLRKSASGQGHGALVAGQSSSTGLQPGSLAGRAASLPSLSPPAVAAVESQVRKPRKPRKRKDPGAPKRALPAFLYYAREMRAQVVAEDPHASIVSIASKMGSMWRALSNEERAPYENLALADRRRYDEEIKAWRAEQSSHPVVPAVPGHQHRLPAASTTAEPALVSWIHDQLLAQASTSAASVSSGGNGSAAAPMSG